MHHDAALQGVIVRILLRAVERWLREHSPGSTAAARSGAVVFIHRFGAAPASTLSLSLRARTHTSLDKAVSVVGKRELS